LTLAIGLIISAVGVWLVARDVDGDRLMRALQSADVSWLLVSASVIVITLFTRAWRWAVLLRPIDLRTSTIMRALLIGQMLNFALPVRLGDVTRVMMLGRAPNNTVERTLGSVAIEKAWDWITLTLIVLIVTAVMPTPDWLIAPTRVIGLIAAIVLIGFAAVALSPEPILPRGRRLIDHSFGWLPLRSRGLVIERLQHLLGSLTALRQRESIGLAAVWSIVTWALGIAANYAVMRAFGVDSWRAAMLLMAVLMIGVTLPPSIAALGLFEGLTILTLRVFDTPYDTALAIGLTLHVVIYMPPIAAAAALSAKPWIGD
jgi:uncharacterized protein (TIRG00374 family)